MLTLPDAYALFNRARGLEVRASRDAPSLFASISARAKSGALARKLISPDDLLDASRLLAPLGLPMTLREVRAAERSGTASARRVSELFGAPIMPRSSTRACA